MNDEYIIESDTLEEFVEKLIRKTLIDVVEYAVDNAQQAYPEDCTVDRVTNAITQALSDGAGQMLGEAAQVLGKSPDHAFKTLKTCTSLMADGVLKGYTNQFITEIQGAAGEGTESEDRTIH